MISVTAEEMYVLVSPDGNWQPTTLADDFPMCVAMITMMAKVGLSKSLGELISNGFEIIPVTVSAMQNGTAEEGFQRQKKSPGPEIN